MRRDFKEIWYPKPSSTEAFPSHFDSTSSFRLSRPCVEAQILYNIFTFLLRAYNFQDFVGNTAEFQLS